MTEPLCMEKCANRRIGALASASCDANERAHCATAKRFREVFEHSSDALFVIGVRNGELYFESVNPVAEVVFGVQAAILEGSAFTDIVEGKLGYELGESMASDQYAYQRCVSTGLPITYLSALKPRSVRTERPRLFRVHLLPLLDDSGIVRVIGIGHDITEHKENEDALLRQTELRDQLASHREDALEVERKRIARDLHEELGQLLTALRMDIATLPIQFGDELRGRALEMQGLIDRAIEGMRNVVSSLRTTTLDAGLYAALEWLCSDFSRRSGIECRLTVPKARAKSLDDSRATAVFRIVQEALTNVSRHAGASCVDICLGVTAREWCLTVRDDGRGFDPKQTGKSSFGILGMRERAGLLGGELMLSASPKSGTQIELRFPVRKAPVRSRRRFTLP